MRTVEVCRWEGPVVLEAFDRGGGGWPFLNAIEEKAGWGLQEVVFLKRHSPHGAAFWRLDDDACGPNWTKTFLADLFNTVEKRCHYHRLFLTWVRGHDEIFTPSLLRRGSLRKHWCSDVGDDRDLLCCSGFISSTSDEQAIQGSAWSSLAKLWVRWLVRIFPLPWLDRRQSGMTLWNTLWMLFLCPRRRNAPAGRPAKLCDSDPFLSTSISASASVALSARCSEETNLRRREK